MNVYMLKNPHYHKVACALLLAAGICYGFGQYKYTIDLASPYGLFQVSVVRASGVGTPPCQSTTEINDPRFASATPVLLVLGDVSYVAVCGRVERSLALYVVIIGSESSLGPNHCVSVAMLSGQDYRGHSIRRHRHHSCARLLLLRCMPAWRCLRRVPACAGVHLPGPDTRTPS